MLARVPRVTIRRILVVGSGGREHALAWRLARDPGSPEVLVAPGNDGMAAVARRLAVEEDDLDGLRAACRREAPDLVVIGPEKPLSLGLADLLEGDGHVVFGARQRAARIESSKAFAKDVMHAARVPTAPAECFESAAPACAALDRLGPPWVIKADGLAAGKGVCVTREREEAERFLVAVLEEGRFGEAGRRVLIEAFLPGEEVSVMAVCDGERFALLPAAHDHKRSSDGEQGPNTGGMGAWAPVPLEAGLERRIGEEIVQPVLGQMVRAGAPFRGLLYAGLMIENGRASVVEFNARFGDPETEAVVPILGGSLGELLRGAATGSVDPAAVERVPGVTVAVALVDARYPEPGGGGVIEGLEGLEGRPDVWVFHAGTIREQGCWRVRGGRAAYVVAAAATREAARTLAYEAVSSLGGTGWRARSDIGAPSGARVEAEVRRGASG